MPAQLSLRDVSVSRGDRLLLDGVSLSVRPGERIGVVGENGAGKSTLLRLLAGLERPADGTVVTSAGGGIGHLGQTPALPMDSTVAQVIDAALADLRAMEGRLRELEAGLDAAGAEALAEYGEVLTAFEARGGYEADARVDKALHGLGVAHIARERRLGSLSGGEQARLGLACLLAAAPEVMLLDEPTNHLDAAALTWLEDSLRAHSGTVVAVSHDRVFLERVATAVIEVDADRRTLVRYGGGYAGYVAGRAAARGRWEQAYARWCAETQALVEAAATTARDVAVGRAIKDGNKMAYDRNGGRVQSSVSSRVRNAHERLRRLREEPVPRPPDPLRFAARPEAGAAEGELVTLEGIRVGDRLTVDALTVRAGGRLLVHGPNGAGKTTLLRLMAGAAHPDTGTVRRRGRIGYLAQEIPVDRPAERLADAFRRGLPGDAEEQRELLLSYGLFRERDLHVPVGSLSVGQRRRLGLARLLARPADLLLLDEPTNHLALGLVEELEQALAAWPGAVVIVSHDRALSRRFAGDRCEIRDGRTLITPAGPGA
ncbi:ABC-F family ATP-binding cassette domain-containing protein [Streptomyces griseocarneus]|uniref:ABC-F family ATP-binding cassette domain-containing protein n=1 Tax=Streptomyces griseocarneus TaxID=51201 RepID=UPI00167E6642|nr:ABC-F family ATP-binding cassette domain-containing protein [Streptomyces griseocarneus]MBZ6472403.1 ATP-binding cassette domain-containing protein [Streptomyces griseocarneus]GHG44978.1 ABC transporter ATP-binding protein [Streptomyces griseocarneus]